MTAGNDVDSPASVSGAPLDAARLDVIHERFTTDDRFVQVDEQPEYAPGRLVSVYNTRFYPGSVQQARLEIASLQEQPSKSIAVVASIQRVHTY